MINGCRRRPGVYADWPAANWTGDDGVPHRLVEHCCSPWSRCWLAMAIGLPLALWLGHQRRFGTLAVNISNVGRAIPIVALLSLLALGCRRQRRVRPVRPGRPGHPDHPGAVRAAADHHQRLRRPSPGSTTTCVEAARGMGMDERQVLRRVELPLALPLIVAGVRLAVVQVWATATIAALVAGPGLGRIITHGYDSNRPAEVDRRLADRRRDRAGARGPDGVPTADARSAASRQSLESSGSGLVHAAPGHARPSVAGHRRWEP